MSDPLRLFEGFGVELEYMIVDRDTLAVRPISDVLLRDELGNVQSETEHGPVAWSNELTAHVIELKTNGPANTLDGLAEQFQSQVSRINAMLSSHNAALMPTAMHPLMNPHQEMTLWQHDDSPIYAAFDRIFNCHGHGWANLQSVHINLPFHGDAEFARLHAAIRLVLPLLPALAASSPIVEGQTNGILDNRLHYYRFNAQAIPSVTAHVIPEAVYTRDDYDREIFQRMYRDIAPHDPQQILQQEWLNARGAIARFDRGAIEIRVLDIQEYPAADLEICTAIVAVLKSLVSENCSSLSQQQAAPTEDLARLLEKTIQSAERAEIDDPRYLELMGVPISGRESVTAGEVWSRLCTQITPDNTVENHSPARLSGLINRGSLATRITSRLGPLPSREDIVAVYRELMSCLATGTPFHA